MVVPSKSFSAHRVFWPLIFLVAAVLWFGHEMVWPGKVPFFRDLSTYFYPMRYSLAESFKIGQLPLWDRHIAMGYPLLANFQSGAFYPPHLFYLAFPFFTAVGVTFVFHYLIAATGAYTLCRQWSYPPYLALTGACLFTFGGTIVSLTNLLNHFQTAVWLPWILLFGEKAFRSAGWRHFLLLTLALALQFLAGSPEFFAMSAVILLVDGLRLSMGRGLSAYGRVVWILAAANLIVVALTMAQILPTLELMLESRARTGLGIAQAGSWSLHPLSLINLFFLERQIDLEHFTSPKLFFLSKTPFLLTHYIGVVSLFGIALWFSYAGRKEKILLIGALALGLSLALGGYTPVHAFAYRYVPFFSFFRFPEKFFFISYALLLFAALEGIYRFGRDERPRKPVWVALSLVAVIPSLALFVFRLRPEWLAQGIAWATSKSIIAGPELAKSSALLVNFERQAALVIAVMLLFVLGKKQILRTFLFQGLLVALVFVDLSSAHRPYQYLLSPDFVYKEPRLVNSPNHQPDRLFYRPDADNPHPSFYKIPKELAFETFNRLVFSSLLPNTGVFNGFDYMQEIDALGRWPYLNFLGFASQLPPERLHRLLGNLNVRHINSFHPLATEGITLANRFPKFPAWHYTIDRVIPRVYVVPEIVVEQGPGKILDRLSSAEFEPLKEVMIEEPLPTSPSKGFKGEVEIVRYGNQEVTLRASLNGSGVLVLADSFYPGWRVYVDGNEERILRANLFFRGVPLGKGDHRVEFRYDPVSFKIGLAMSLVTLCGLLLFVIRRTLFRKPRERDPIRNSF